MKTKKGYFGIGYSIKVHSRATYGPYGGILIDRS